MIQIYNWGKYLIHKKCEVIFLLENTYHCRSFNEKTMAPNGEENQGCNAWWLVLVRPPLQWLLVRPRKLGVERDKTHFKNMPQNRPIYQPLTTNYISNG